MIGEQCCIYIPNNNNYTGGLECDLSILLVMRKVLTKSLFKQMTMVATAQKAEAQLAQLVEEIPDLFPIPSYLTDSDTDTMNSEK